jgi:hypothetical protein
MIMCARTSRRLLIIAFCAATVASVVHPVSAAQSVAASDEDRLLLGTWKLNVAKSRYRVGPPPLSQVRTYEPHGESVKATIVTVYADGRSTTVGYVANYDSLEYAVTGSPDADTITLKKVAPRTAQAELSHAGMIMAKASRTISEDGLVMTIAYKGELMGRPVDYVAVYDKQP